MSHKLVAIYLIFFSFSSYNPAAKKKSVLDHTLAAVISIPVHHPIRLISNLIQFGYEPYPPARHYSFLVRQYLYYYPGVFGYARNIIKERGWMALYRGVGPALAEEIALGLVGDAVKPLVYSFVSSLPLSEVPTNDDTPDTIENVQSTRATIVRGIKGFLLMSISGCVIEVAVRPLRVITLRTIAQHVGEETIYNGFVAAVKEIYRSEGLRGFYNGIIPALFHHVMSALVYQGVFIAIEEIVHLLSVGVIGGSLIILKGPIASYVTRSYTYPFSLISNISAINSTSLAAAKFVPSFVSWREGWRLLRSTGNLYRGTSILLPRFAHSDPRNKL